MATIDLQGFPAVQTALDEYEKWSQRINCNTVDKLNYALEHGKAAGIILISEALQERKIAGIADMVQNNPGIKVILIAGPSSSGKTSFTQRLRIQLAVDAVRTKSLSMDNYFVERVHTPRKSDGTLDYECPEAVDMSLFNEQLCRLAAGETVQLPYYDFKTGTKTYRGKTMQLKENTVLIVEGIHALNKNMTARLADEHKLPIYISALNPLDLPDGSNVNPADVRLMRRIVRDNHYRGYDAASTIGMWPTVLEGENKYIYNSALNARIVVNTSLIYELNVLKPYLIFLLTDCLLRSDAVGDKARELAKILQSVKEIPEKDIPTTSLMREFIGGSAFAGEL